MANPAVENFVKRQNAKTSGSGIHIKPSREGSLHTMLHVPQDKPIPPGKLAKAVKSKNPVLKKKAVFAKNAKGFKHAGKKRTRGPAKSPEVHVHLHMKGGLGEYGVTPDTDQDQA